MSPKKSEKKLTWKQIDIEGKLDTLLRTIKKTKNETPENKTRLERSIDGKNRLRKLMIKSNISKEGLLQDWSENWT